MRLLLLLFSLTSCISIVYSQDVAREIDSYLRKNGRGGPYNGCVLVAKKGTVLLNKGYGYRNTRQAAPNDTNTLFRVGSVSKSITATLVLQLAEQKKLSIEDPLSKYIPDYPNGERITVFNLLTHSSGIKEYLATKGIQQLKDSSPPISIERLIGFFKFEPLTIEPGKKFTYSNSNYILLAYIIEKITHNKFEEAARQMIFEPLGMNSTSFNFIHSDRSRKAAGYGNILKKDEQSDFDSTYAPGCGSMYSTTGDLYRFYRGLYSGKIIADSTREDAFKPRFGNYGLGWFRTRQFGRRCIFHPGGVPGFYAELKFFPDDDVCIVLTSNSSSGHVDIDRVAKKALK